MSNVEPVAREFWRWLQLKLRVDRLADFKDILVDATSLEVTLFARVGEGSLERFPNSNFCKKTVEKRWYFGRALHLTTASNGTLFQFRLAKASVFDGKMLSHFKLTQVPKVTGDPAYRGNKGYPGQKISLTKPWGSKKPERRLAGIRVRIEQVFSALKRLGLEGRLLITSARSLGSHVVSTLACFLAIQYLNLKHGLSPLAYKHFLL